MSHLRYLAVAAAACAACTANTLVSGPTESPGEPTSPGRTPAAEQTGVPCVPAADGGTPPQHLPEAFLERFVADKVDFALIGTALEVKKDAKSMVGSSGGLEWHIYYDEIRLQSESVISRVPTQAELLTTYPARCEAFKDGVLVPEARMSDCPGREPSYTAIVGERAIFFVGGGVHLLLKLPISSEGTVDLSNFGEGTEASLEDTVLRIQKILSEPYPPPPPPEPFFESFIANQVDLGLIGTVLEVQQEAESEVSSYDGLEWHIYSDVVRLQSECVIGRNPTQAELLTTYPVRCEAFKDGVLVPGVMMSGCMARQPGNTPIVGERAIFLVSGGGMRRLMLKLPVSSKGTVDLSNLGEGTEAPLEDTVLRIHKILSARYQ